MKISMIQTLQKRKSMSAAGFSLVELMVVVAIIGILATMAVPQINKFMAKARQAEAKTSLSSIYTANKSFFAEYQGYTSSLAAMGYAPEGELRYNSGWDNNKGECPGNYTGTCNTKSSFIDICATIKSDGVKSCWLMNGTNGAQPDSIANSEVPSAASYQKFKAGASAYVRGANADTWTINETKSIENTYDGVNN